ncbi:MAG TPA: ABC transporter permease, partial [Terracidiphilus sp.]
MRKFRAFMVRLASIFRTQKAESEFASELESNIAMMAEEGVRTGLNPEEARRRALIQLGGAEQLRQAHRDRRTLPWFENLLRDVRHALRDFRRAPIFSVTVITTLALGVGSATAVFSVVDLILFRPLPYAQAGRIVSVGLVHSLEKDEFMMGGFYFDWLDHQRPFAVMASQGTMVHSCDLVENNPEQLSCIPIQAGFLPMLGISPALGHNFLPFEDQPGGPAVALISYSLWSGHYNRDPHILNREIDIDGRMTRVVGVLPRGFELPTLQSADVYLPMALNRATQNKVNGGFGEPMRTFARLKPGVTIAQARAEMQPLFLRTERTYMPPSVRYDMHLSIRSLRERETRGARLPAWILLGSVLAVLLIVCANVAGLMMARGASREREMSVRAALGASKARLIQQSLTEAMILSLAGSAAGLALAKGLLQSFIALAPAGIPFLDRARLDLRIAIFALLLAL